jgi:hypothetical protein
MNKIEAFNIKSIPHSDNSKYDTLANAASKLSPSDDFTHNKFSIELIYEPSIPDNITNWIIFNDNQQIIDFLHSEDTFRGSVIGDEHHEALI